MSDKLVAEFWSEDSPLPVAVVLACHGGDNPASAAFTIAEFLDELSILREPRFDDAGLLATRFITWLSQLQNGVGRLDFVDISLIPFSTNYGYQLARIHARPNRPSVQMIRDQYSTTREMEDAAILLRRHGVQPPND